jgi:hypothetical protein
MPEDHGVASKLLAESFEPYYTSNAFVVSIPIIAVHLNPNRRADNPL